MGRARTKVPKIVELREECPMCKTSPIEVETDFENYKIYFCPRCGWAVEE